MPSASKTVALTAALAAGLLAAAPAATQEGAGTIQLEADQAELNNATGVSVYTGDVELTRGETVITGDRMEVHTNEARRLERVVVTGSPATYRGRREAEGRVVRGEAPRMTYHAGDEARVELTGGGVLWQGENRFEGETLVYRLNADTVTADSADGERIRITLFPEQAGDGGDDP